MRVALLPSITPIFTLSNVSGESLEHLKVFFNILPPLSNSKEQEELMQQLTEFQVRCAHAHAHAHTHTHTHTNTHTTRRRQWMRP